MTHPCAVTVAAWLSHTCAGPHEPLPYSWAARRGWSKRLCPKLPRVTLLGSAPTGVQPSWAVSALTGAQPIWTASAPRLVGGVSLRGFGPGFLGSKFQAHTSCAAWEDCQSASASEGHSGPWQSGLATLDPRMNPSTPVAFLCLLDPIAHSCSLRCSSAICPPHRRNQPLDTLVAKEPTTSSGPRQGAHHAISSAPNQRVVPLVALATGER